MHEVYLWYVRIVCFTIAPWLTMHRPFQDAVKAGTANIMCSYQRVNNSYGCSNSKTLNGLLKTELGFQVCVATAMKQCQLPQALANQGLSFRASLFRTGMLSMQVWQLPSQDSIWPCPMIKAFGATNSLKL